MNLLKLLIVCAIILFASSHVNAAVIENNPDDVSNVFRLGLGE